MSQKKSTTVRLDSEDVAALARAREDGLSSSELIGATSVSSRRGTTAAGGVLFEKTRR